ncbi:beta-galactosidase precursor [mine drainage metagenome]|uniref:Beta-galactosidase n=1 Tax=mine drainage metagenome TaxID=410659 RepID=A0A1J5P5F2_9ZZZZ
MNGANMSRTEPYSPQTSSYDYDAPVDEAGNATAKFYKFRAVIEKHLPAGVKLPPVPKKIKTIAINNIVLNGHSALFNNLGKPVIAEHPLCFEDLNQGYGLVLYRTTLKNAVSGLLKIKQLRDYATIYLNGKRVSVLDRRLRQDSVQISSTEPNTVLDILVENNGRINYGPYLTDNRQGITEKVTLNNDELTGWKMYKFPFSTTPLFKYGTNKGTNELQPALYKGSFTLTKTGDTFLDLHGFGKGFVFLNGRNLGKYWYIGPQQTLYIPASWLNKGINQIVVFDELKGDHKSISTLDHPVLNEVVKE